jgi:serine/threonine-protein kinase
MGEVYKARDTKLGREVAVKVLPEAFAENKERLARFEREARLLASLNHPNIATIHGLEESDGVRFLVMELVEGETLAERIKRGPIPVDEALPLFKQIAEGLEAAHEKGVIHRDLKPANIKVTPEGKVKVLDFGLAKAMEPEVPDADSSQSPTLTKNTALGAIMGTAAYMSPEQARGKPVGEQTDIWAFGCCLYEALTGKKAYEGETVTDTLAAIVNKEPDWDRIPNTVPWKIQELARRSMRKDPSRRLHDIADARVDIEDVLGGAPEIEQLPTAAQSPSPSWLRLAVLPAMTALLGGIIAWALMRPSLQKDLPVTRFTISLPEGQVLGGPALPFAISCDGRRLTYVAQQGSSSQLYIREMRELEARPLPGTEDASNPFFSPDGQWIGFFANGRLKKVPSAGGEALTVCGAPAFIRSNWGGGSVWNSDGDIFFSAWEYGLLRVSADGGEPEPILKPDADRFFVWPSFLPDRKNLLLSIGLTGESQLTAVSIETGERRALTGHGAGARRAQYVRTGHLVYAESGALWAVRFDPETLESIGAPLSIVKNLTSMRTVGEETIAYLSISDTGTLVFASGQEAVESEIVYVDRNGGTRSIAKERSNFSYPRVSPDGNRVALQVGSPQGSNIWIYDLVRGTRTRMISGGLEAVWTPDGSRIVYSDSTNLFWKPSDGSGEAEMLTSIHPSENEIRFACSVSKDNVVAFYRVPPDAPRDIWTMPLDGDRSESPFEATEFDEHSPVFSPDGRWIAYVSDESGGDEIYVRPYPGPGARYSISTEGGREPIWSSDGREIFYRNGNQMMSVSVETKPEFKAEAPRALFEGQYDSRGGAGISYSVSPNGQRFLMIRKPRSLPTELNVVTNWFEELKRLVPPN